MLKLCLVIAALFCIAIDAEKCPFNDQCDCSGIFSQIDRVTCDFRQCSPSNFTGSDRHYSVKSFIITGCVRGIGPKMFSPFSSVETLRIAPTSDSSELDVSQWPADTFRDMQIWNLELIGLNNAIPVPSAIELIQNNVSRLSVQSTESISLTSNALGDLRVQILELQHVRKLEISADAFRQYDLSNFSLIDVGLSEFPTEALQNAARVATIVLRNTVVAYRSGAFAKINKLKSLEIYGNESSVLDVPPEAFDDLPQELIGVTLSYLNLARVPSGIKALRHLMYLEFSFCQFRSLAFDQLPDPLLSLMLTGNPIAEIIPPTDPMYLPVVRLSVDESYPLDLSIFSNQPRLISLFIDQAYKTVNVHVSDPAKVPLSGGQGLFIASCSLVTLDRSVDKYLNDISTAMLGLWDSQMNCNSDIVWMKDHIGTSNGISFKNVTCANYESYSVENYLLRGPPSLLSDIISR